MTSVSLTRGYTAALLLLKPASTDAAADAARRDQILALSRSQIGVSMTPGAWTITSVAFDGAQIQGGGGNDWISAYANATISGGAGDDAIETYDYAVVNGDAGDDYIRTYAYATVNGGAGNDRIRSYDYATLSGGDGNDSLSAYSYAQIDAGSGDDRVSVYDYARVNAGAGDDLVRASGNATVDGGAGNDEIRVYDYARVKAGDGDDLVVTLGNATIDGGAGDDMLIVSDHTLNDGMTFGHSTVDGGSGDDYIQAGASSTVRGGVGDDTIRLTGDQSTVEFTKGDGRDAIASADDLTVKIQGYGKNDVSVTEKDGAFVLSFKGGADWGALNLTSGTTARIAFDDGSTMDVVGKPGSMVLQDIVANPDQSSSSHLGLGLASRLYRD